MKLYLDPGHGGTDPGASSNGLKEKNLTLKIALKIRNLLKDYKNVAVKMSRTTDKTVSLGERTNEANSWKADYFLSIHINAFDGKANGYEDFIFEDLSNSSKTAKLRNDMHDELKKLDFYNRGKKKQNFHVLRETKMSSILTENGFIDNKEDAKKLKKDSFLDEIAEAHVKGLEKAFNLKKKENSDVQSNSNTFYRVVTGSFQDRKNAEQRVKDLKNKGFNSFIDIK